MAEPEGIVTDYATYAEEIIPRFEQLSTAEILAPVSVFLPREPSYILDVGAGTGRDANWFANQGHRVVAAEPVNELAEHGKRLHSTSIEWVDDRLPDLCVLRRRKRLYDVILVGAVWHHLDRDESIASLRTLRALLATKGRLILSLKQFVSGSRNDSQVVSREALSGDITKNGLRVVYSASARSHQAHNMAAGTTWVWFVAEHDQGGCP